MGIPEAVKVVLDGKSLGCLDKDNRFRVWLKNFMYSYYSERFIFFVILLNSFSLMMDEPVRTDPYFKTTLSSLNLAISAIFVIEFFIRILVLGFCRGKHAFL